MGLLLFSVLYRFDDKINKSALTQSKSFNMILLSRFFAVWQDPNDPLEETRHFRIHFYLSDGTVEVRPEYKTNDGHYHYPTLVSRQQLPRHQHTGYKLRETIKIIIMSYWHYCNTDTIFVF